jgi:hypothetical protein
VVSRRDFRLEVEDDRADIRAPPVSERSGGGRYQFGTPAMLGHGPIAP